MNIFLYSTQVIFMQFRLQYPRCLLPLEYMILGSNPIWGVSVFFLFLLSEDSSLYSITETTHNIAA